MTDSMQEAHDRDYSDERRLRDLRNTLQDFIADPPSRAHRGTLAGLSSCVGLIEKDMAHIVQVWD